MKEISYEFIGKESDRSKFVDPEPEIGRLYSSKQYEKFYEDNFDNLGMPFHDLFREVISEVDVPLKYANDILTPMMRLEILKAFPDTFYGKTLEALENYIAFGSK